jgi:hypothetical protein
MLLLVVIWWEIVRSKSLKKKYDIISSLERQIEDEWDVEASFIIKDEELAMTMIIKDQINYENDIW